MQLALLVCSLLMLLAVLLYLPETSHPGSRGVDRLDDEKPKLVWLNPCKCLDVLRSPNILLVVRVISHFGPSSWRY